MTTTLTSSSNFNKQVSKQINKTKELLVEIITSDISIDSKKLISKIMNCCATQQYLDKKYNGIVFLNFDALYILEIENLVTKFDVNHSILKNNDNNFIFCQWVNDSPLPDGLVNFIIKKIQKICST